MSIRQRPTVTLLSSAARNASGAGTDVVSPDTLEARTLVCLLDVTAQSGTTPTLDVVIQAKIDGQYVNLARFSQTAATTGKKVVVVQRGRTPAAEFAPAADPVVGTGYLSGDFEWSDTFRVKYTLAGGTPNYTFSVSVFPLADVR